MKKILIISYGGTIVMVVDEKRRAVVPAKDIETILKNVPKLKETADLEFKILSNVDSTNVTPNDWTHLAEFIADNHDKYDGFVVTHGTNTMAYSASALALALGSGIKKPVVLTGSQLPLTVYGNDARFNLENAVKTAVIAAKQNIAEIMIVFYDVVLRGARSVKVSESSFRAFESPSFPNIGDIKSTGIHFNQYALQKNDDKFELWPRFERGVLAVDLIPGQLPEIIEESLKSGKCNGLILKSHGAGSVPTVDQYSFLPLIKKSVEEYKVPVLVSTKFMGGNASKEINDEPAVQAIEAGAIPTGDLTDVMTEVKLMWLLAQGHKDTKDLRELIIKNFVGEVTN